MRRRGILKRSARLKPSTWAQEEDELALQVVVLYEDPLTRKWTRELWGRVHHLIGSGGICRKVWRISDLGRAEVLADAAQAAARAHVLVISLRDAGMLPPRFCDWVEAWVPRRTAFEGAMVALIGMPSQPDTGSGQAYPYLASIARRAGLDFLPHERKLPEGQRLVLIRRAVVPQ